MQAKEDKSLVYELLQEFQDTAPLIPIDQPMHAAIELAEEDFGALDALR